MPILAAPLPHTPHCLPAYGHWIRRSWHAIVSRRPSRVTSLCARICRKNKNSRIRELHSDSPSTRGASFTSVVQIPMIVGILLRTLRSFHHQLVKGSRRGLPSVEHGDPPFLSSDSCEMPVIRQSLTFVCSFCPSQYAHIYEYFLPTASTIWTLRMAPANDPGPSGNTPNRQIRKAPAEAGVFH